MVSMKKNKIYLRCLAIPDNISLYYSNGMTYVYKKMRQDLKKNEKNSFACWLSVQWFELDFVVHHLHQRMLEVVCDSSEQSADCLTW